MIADLLVVAILLIGLDRISRGAWINWVKTRRVPWAAVRASRYFWITAAIVVIAVCGWAQQVARFGARVTLETAWSGTPVAESEQCFRAQRNVLRMIDGPDTARCPVGGGEFSLARGGGCPVHGRTP